MSVEISAVPLPIMETELNSEYEQPFREDFRSRFDAGVTYCSKSSLHYTASGSINTELVLTMWVCSTHTHTLIRELSHSRAKTHALGFSWLESQ